ncbi:MAG: hypothetical protein DYG88_18240 [Chloroflexi bacterium CFX4]|nr:hypothetical protein [Chloroflexi bacterium CFX4]
MRHLLVLLLFLLLCRAAVGFAVALATPPWEAYDEPFHFAYAAQLAQQGTRPDSTNPMHIHPPAYYTLLAAFMVLSGSAQTPIAPPDHNLYFYEGNGGINFALPARTAEQHRTVHDLIAARLFTALFALIAVSLTFRAACAAGLPTALTLSAAALFAFYPQYLFSSSTLNNDAAAVLIGALIVWLLVESVRRRAARFALAALVLSIIGNAFKLNVLPLAAAACFGLALCLSWQRLMHMLIIGGGVLVLGLLLLSNMGILLPFAAEVHGQAAPLAVWQALTGELGGALLSDALRYGVESAFGIFGWGTLRLPLWVNALLWLCVLSALIGLGRLWRQRLVWLLLSACAVLCAAGLALSLLYYNGQLLNSRYLLPSLAAWMLLLAFGWNALGKVGRRLGVGAALTLICLGVWLPYGWLSPSYAPPLRFAAAPTSEGILLTPTIRLRAYETLSAAVRGGETVALALTWQAEGVIHENYTLRLAFIGADGGGYGWLHTFHGAGLYPTAAWQAGTAFREVYALPVRRDVPAPSVGYVQVTLVEAGVSVLLEGLPIQVR